MKAFSVAGWTDDLDILKFQQDSEICGCRLTDVFWRTSQAVSEWDLNKKPFMFGKFQKAALRKLWTNFQDSISIYFEVKRGVFKNISLTAAIKLRNHVQNSKFKIQLLPGQPVQKIKLKPIKKKGKNHPTT